MAIDTREIATPDPTTFDTTPPLATTSPVRSRRAILAGALGGLGGLLASRLGAPDTASAAAGDPLLIGNTTNTAGTSNTSLTTASTGTALLVTQNGSGTALRGSAVGAGSIAGFFTAQNGTGISGVTGSPNTYGTYAANNGAAGSGAALRAAGGNNDGVVATTGNGGKYAVKASNTAAAFVGGAAVRADGGANVGVHGFSTVGNGVEGDSTSGFGVFGLSTNNSGVRGNSTSGYGLEGVSSSGNGVVGSSSTGVGVFGTASNSFGVRGVSTNNHGVRGDSVNSSGVAGTSSSGNGVEGTATTGIGVYGSSTSGWAGFFSGSLYADSANAAIKAFRIDHPQDPANKVLEHSCVESNERKLVYDGTVTTDAAGEATIDLPAYFDALNIDLRYQLTPLGAAMPELHIGRPVKGNRFTIAGAAPSGTVCWQVTGVRHDAYAKAHPLVVESAKKGKEKGRYLHPLEAGKPESAGVAYALRQEAPRPGA